MILSLHPHPRGHLALSGEMFHCQDWEGSLPGKLLNTLQWSGQLPTTEDCPAQNVNSSGGASVAHLVKHPTLDFCSGHDLTVGGFKPHIGLCADSSEPGTCFGFCLSLPLSLPLSLSLSQK